MFGWCSKSAVAIVVSLIVALPAFSQATSSEKKSAPRNLASPTTESLNERERALHALNRLTFGPRPGDVEAVLAKGVDDWIEDQLHPESIDDSASSFRRTE